MKTLLSTLVFTVLSSMAFAGGSASQSFILSELADDVKAMMKADYELASSGMCVRMRDGSRMLPCTIEGRNNKNGDLYLITVAYTADLGEVSYTEEKVQQ